MKKCNLNVNFKLFSSLTIQFKHFQLCKVFGLVEMKYKLHNFFFNELILKMFLRLFSVFKKILVIPGWMAELLIASTMELFLNVELPWPRHWIEYRGRTSIKRRKPWEYGGARMFEKVYICTVNSRKVMDIACLLSKIFTR